MNKPDEERRTLNHPSTIADKDWVDIKAPDGEPIRVRVGIEGLWLLIEATREEESGRYRTYRSLIGHPKPKRPSKLRSQK